MSSSNETELPTLPEHVTAAWLGSKLGHKVKSAEMTRAIWGTESKLFYTLTYEEESAAERPIHICIKGVFDPAMLAAQPWTLLLAQREAVFYNEMAPKVKHMGHPKCWWAGTSEKQGISIMEDLTASGCTFIEPKETWSVEKVLKGVEQLAGLHGQFWGAKVEDHPCKSYMDSYIRIYPHAHIYMYRVYICVWRYLLDINNPLTLIPDAVNVYDSSMQFLCAPWDATTHSDGRPPVPEYLKDGKRFNDAHNKYFATRNPKFRTILHGDTHAANTYFTADGSPRWLDWSAIHTGSCFHDVSYFICGALSIADRRESETRILQHYLDALHRFGGPQFSAQDEDVQVEFRRSYIANCIWIVCPYELQPKETVTVLCERTVAAWEDHKILELIESQDGPTQE